MITNTTKYGIRNAPARIKRQQQNETERNKKSNEKQRKKKQLMNAPPPFSNAVNGNRQILPKPTDIAIHDIKNSISLPQLARSLTFAVGWPLAAVVSATGDDIVDTPFGCK